MRQNKIFLSFIIILVLYASRKTAYFYAYIIFGAENYKNLDETIKTIIIQTTGLLLPVLMVAVFNRFSFKKIMSDFGLANGFKEGLLYAAIFVLPMFIGNLIFSPIRSNIQYSDVYSLSIWPGFNEELIFRGILIGQLIKRAGWGFIPASLLSSFYFASGHLYQSHDILSAIQIFLVTASAGVGFALCFIEWSWNLWLPMFLHILMNLHTVFFDTGNNAALNLTGNIFRFTTIAFAIFFTIRRIKNKGSFIKGKLWINKSVTNSE